MDMSPQEYQAYVKGMQKKSPLLKDMALAFGIGGAICVVGQLVIQVQPREQGRQKHQTDGGGGAGTLVPITGFANAVVSPAMDFRAEGLITGMAAKMFLIAGPVIVFGTAASVVYGVVLWLLGG